MEHSEFFGSHYHFTDGGYAFTGNTTAFLEMEDGVNGGRKNLSGGGELRPESL